MLSYNRRHSSDSRKKEKQLFKLFALRKFTKQQHVFNYEKILFWLQLNGTDLNKFKGKVFKVKKTVQTLINVSRSQKKKAIQSFLKLFDLDEFIKLGNLRQDLNLKEQVDKVK